MNRFKKNNSNEEGEIMRCNLGGLYSVFLLIMLSSLIFAPANILAQAEADKIICPQCGKINDKGANFCWNDGYDLSNIIKIEKKKVETKEIRGKMIAISVKPPTTPSKYYAFRVGKGFGNIPAIENLGGSTENENSGSGIGGAYQLWFALRPNFHIGLIAGGIEFTQEDGNVTNTRMVEYINLTARKYPQNKNVYFEGAISLSRLSQKSVETDYSLGSNYDETVLFDSSVNGFGISAGIGTILIRGKQYEILLNGNFAYNFFEGGRNSFLFGFNVEIMVPRLITK